MCTFYYNTGEKQSKKVKGQVTKTFFTEQNNVTFLTCHSKKSTGVINNNYVLFRCARCMALVLCMLAHWNGTHNSTETSLMLIVTPVLFLL